MVPTSYIPKRLPAELYELYGMSVSWLLFELDNDPFKKKDVQS